MSFTHSYVFLEDSTDGWGWLKSQLESGRLMRCAILPLNAPRGASTQLSSAWTTVFWVKSEETSNKRELLCVTFTPSTSLQSERALLDARLQTEQTFERSLRRA